MRRLGAPARHCSLVNKSLTLASTPLVTPRSACSPAPLYRCQAWITKQQLWMAVCTAVLGLYLRSLPNTHFSIAEVPRLDARVTGEVSASSCGCCWPDGGPVPVPCVSLSSLCSKSVSGHHSRRHRSSIRTRHTLVVVMLLYASSCLIVYRRVSSCLFVLSSVIECHSVSSCPVVRRPVSRCSVTSHRVASCIMRHHLPSCRVFGGAVRRSSRRDRHRRQRRSGLRDSESAGSRGRTRHNGVPIRGAGHGSHRSHPAGAGRRGGAGTVDGTALDSDGRSRGQDRVRRPGPGVPGVRPGVYNGVSCKGTAVAHSKCVQQTRPPPLRVVVPRPGLFHATTSRRSTPRVRVCRSVDLES